MNNGKICVPVCSETADGMIENIKCAEKFADVIEVRFDCLDPKEIDAAIGINNGSKKPLIVTYRNPAEGGHGTAEFKDRVEFWNKIPLDFGIRDFESDIASAAMGPNNSINSFHDFHGVPKNIAEIYEAMFSGADIRKIAVKASDVCDAIPVWQLLDRAKTDGKGIIPIAMGEAGKWTRILGLAHGAFLTYASLDSGKETADGQITAKDMVEVYRVKELDRNTRVYGIIGDPVAGSLSPYMLNPAFVDYKINAVYLPLLVKDLDSFMTRMVKKETREVELDFGGFSVTMPHKQAIMKHLDAIDPTAEKIGAVNTVGIEDDKLTGYNTDAYGFITPLKERFGDLKDARVAVFGAGGAARACIYALKGKMADVTVFARDVQKAESLGEEFEAEHAEIGKADLQDFDIVVNTTPLGMKGPLENDSLFTAEQLKGVKFVYDLVTRSTDTPIICEAKKTGILAIDGFEMLIAQGAKQFEIWTGREAPVELMRNSLLSRNGS